MFSTIIDRLLQADRFGIKPYCLLVKKEEQHFDNFDEINCEKSLGIIDILEIGR